MKWIKASERLPGNDSPQFIRINGELRRMGNFWQDKGKMKLHIPIREAYDIDESKFDHVEWLDESTPSVPDAAILVEALDGIVKHEKLGGFDNSYHTLKNIARETLAKYNAQWQSDPPPVSEEGGIEEINPWLKYHGITRETDETELFVTGYGLRETYFGGKWHGYPECCILHHLKKSRQEHDEYKQKYDHSNPDPHNYNGFVPCPKCIKRIESGEIKPKELIQNRLAGANSVRQQGQSQTGESRNTGADNLEQELIDILYDANGTGSGANDVVNYLIEKYHITRKQ